MIRRLPEKQLAFARRLRREMTLAETLLWRGLRNRRSGAKFRRQVPIGPFVADFACVEAKLIIELDGPPHEHLQRRLRDIERDTWLRTQGWRVLRFPNDLAVGDGSEIVLKAISDAIAQTKPPSSALRGAKGTFSR